MSHNPEPILRTPDHRYMVIDGRLWRSSNPGLLEDVRQRLVCDLMVGRREVKQAKKCADPDKLRAARARVHAAKVGLGERGAPWWDDGSPDLNRKMVANTPYASWYGQLDKV